MHIHIQIEFFYLFYLNLFYLNLLYLNLCARVHTYVCTNVRVYVRTQIHIEQMQIKQTQIE